MIWIRKPDDDPIHVFAKDIEELCGTIILIAYLALVNRNKSKLKMRAPNFDEYLNYIARSINELMIYVAIVECRSVKFPEDESYEIQEICWAVMSLGLSI